MLIPYASDAPIYHRPWGTIGLIIANLLVFGFGNLAEVVDIDDWVLWYGDFSPWQWIASAFAHIDIFHLLGNMVFLWSFGLIIEGKLGWRYFLPLYVLLAIAPNILEQVIMLGSVGGSLGASTAISGLIAIALIWAPHNRMDVVLWLVIRPFNFELPVWGLALFYIGWDFVSALWMGFDMSTPVLHLLGVIFGFPAGLLMLRKGWVDCEGWDLLSRGLSGSARQRPSRIRQGREEDAAKREAERLAERQTMLADAVGMAEAYLAEGELDAVQMVLHNAEANHGPWDPPTELVERLVQALWRAKRYDDFEAWAERLVRLRPAAAIGIDLARARLLIEHRRRPQAALDLLQRLAAQPLGAAQQQQARGLRERAEALRAEGVIEFMD